MNPRWLFSMTIIFSMAFLFGMGIERDHNKVQPVVTDAGSVSDAGSCPAAAIPDANGAAYLCEVEVYTRENGSKFIVCSRNYKNAPLEPLSHE